VSNLRCEGGIAVHTAVGVVRPREGGQEKQFRGSVSGFGEGVKSLAIADGRKACLSRTRMDWPKQRKK